MNNKIIFKRIRIHIHLIEFKGAPKAEGYYLKKQDQSHSSYSYASYQRVIASKTVNNHAISWKDISIYIKEITF